jgi:Dolichyl-phosphate-mannose-protein mannosyltransferase
MWRRAATSLTLIVVVATGARLGFAWSQERKIDRSVLGIVPFQNETGNIAYSLAMGKGFSSVFRGDTGPTAWLAPVYPLMVAGIFRIFGIFTVGSFFAVVLMNSVFSAAACVPIYFAGRRIRGIAAASAAAWLWALFPNAIIVPFEWVWDTSLSALLGATILWATLAVTESRRWRDWCGYGLLWGLALMTNPAFASLLPFLLGWAAYRPIRAEQWRFARTVLALCVAILCCLPWTIRNYVVFHRFIPLRSNLPFELWVENNDLFDEHAKNAKQRITQYEEVRRYARMGETAFMNEIWRLAVQFIRQHPGLELRLTGRRFVAFWTGTEKPVKDFRGTDSLVIRVILLLNAMAAVGAAAGIAFLWIQRSPLAFPATVFPIVFPCVYYVTHASLRLKHPIDSVLLLLTAIAADGARTALKEWKRKSESRTV